MARHCASEAVSAPGLNATGPASTVIDDQHAPLGSVDGLGIAPATPIITLAPLQESFHGVPLSANTGQPFRSRWMIAADVLLYIGAGIAAVCYGLYWWNAMHVGRWPGVAKLIEMTNPRPGSAASVWLVVLLAATGALTVAAPALAAFNAWNGYRWSRWAGLVAVATSGLTLLGHRWAWWSIPFVVAGAAVLWLPMVGRYFGQWETFRAPSEPRSEMPENVFYGPLPRFR